MRRKKPCSGIDSKRAMLLRTRCFVSWSRATTSSIALIFIAWLALSHRVAFLEGVRGRLALGLAAGGTLGNLIDRVYYGSVTDFLKAGPWPAFNVADASVVTGMAVLSFLYLRAEHAGGTGRDP